MPARGDEAAHHDEFYGAESERIFSSPLFSAVHAREGALLLRHGLPRGGARVLSLGCGDGRLECLLAPRVGELVGVDISPRAVEEAREHARAARVANARFEVGDVVELHLEPASFDAIWAVAVLHHVDDAGIERLLARCAQLLRPGGLMVSTDPSHRRLVARFRFLVRRQADRYQTEGERDLDLAWVAGAYQRAGLSDVRVRAADFFAGPLAWVAPGLTRRAVRPLMALDGLLTSLPGARSLASTSLVSARRAPAPD